jgi:hypothetical protein
MKAVPPSVDAMTRCECLSADEMAALPDGTCDRPAMQQRAEEAYLACEVAFERGRGTWRHLLAEAFHRAMAETHPGALLARLAEVEAIAGIWSMTINARCAVIQGAIVHEHEVTQ